MTKTILLIGLGGGLGSILRFLVGQNISKWGSFPLATFLINIGGSFLIGLLMAYLHKNPQESSRFFWVTGFCGGFTTFSTFSYENLQILQSGQPFLAVTYTVFSAVVSILACFAGWWLATKM